MAKKKQEKVWNTYRGTYTTLAQNQKDAERAVDKADRKTSKITFGYPKKYGRPIRISPRTPKLR